MELVTLRSSSAIEKQAMGYRRPTINGSALVVTFDMCSSTTIVEELTLCGAGTSVSARG